MLSAGDPAVLFCAWTKTYIMPSGLVTAQIHYKCHFARLISKLKLIWLPLCGHQMVNSHSGKDKQVVITLCE